LFGGFVNAWSVNGFVSAAGSSLLALQSVDGFVGTVGVWWFFLVLQVVGGFSWHCMVVGGFSWCCVVGGFSWHCMVVGGFSWCCMVVGGFSWHCSGFFGIAVGFSWRWGLF